MPLPDHINLEILHHRYERGDIACMFVVAAYISNRHDSVLVRLSQNIMGDNVQRSWSCSDLEDYKIFDFTEEQLEEYLLDACVGLDDNFGKDPGPQKKEIKF